MHIVFTARGMNLSTSLLGGAQYTLDGRAPQAGGDIHFERHLVHGVFCPCPRFSGVPFKEYVTHTIRTVRTPLL